MIDKREFELINPNNPYEPYNRTHLSVFRTEFKKFFPNFPDDVIEQWAYRHFDFFCSLYWDLDYQLFRFKKVLMNRQQILTIKSRMKESEMIDVGYRFSTDNKAWRSESKLDNLMRDNPTWPCPIIVLDTENYSKERCENAYEIIHSPYHLLEGHRRLAIMQELIRNESDYILEEHEVWLISEKGIGS